MLDQKEAVALDDSFNAADRLLTDVKASNNWESKSETIDVLGRFMVRCVCFMSGKGKQSFECKAYAKSNEIKVLFAKEVAAGVNGKLTVEDIMKLMKREDVKLAPTNETSAKRTADDATSVDQSFGELDAPLHRFKKAASWLRR